MSWETFTSLQPDISNIQQARTMLDTFTGQALNSEAWVSMENKFCQLGIREGKQKKLSNNVAFDLLHQNFELAHFTKIRLTQEDVVAQTPWAQRQEPRQSLKCRVVSRYIAGRGSGRESTGEENNWMNRRWENTSTSVSAILSPSLSSHLPPPSPPPSPLSLSLPPHSLSHFLCEPSNLHSHCLYFLFLSRRAALSKTSPLSIPDSNKFKKITETMEILQNSCLKNVARETRANL